MKGIHHHRLEVIPVFRKQAELESLRQNAGRDRFAHRFEATNQQAAAVVADVKMIVMVTEGRCIAHDAFDGLGQKVEMLAGEQRHLGSGHGAHFARPETRAQRDRVTHDGALAGLDTFHPAVFGQDAGDPGLFDEFSPKRLGTLDQRGAHVGRTDPAVIRRPDGPQDILVVHQRPAFLGLPGANGRRRNSVGSGKRLLPLDMRQAVFIGRNRKRALLDPSDRLPGFLFELAVKLDGVLDHARQITGMAKGANLGSGVPGGAGRQLVALQQDCIGHAHLGEMIEG